jgi:flagellar hook assembly protein FlgD
VFNLLGQVVTKLVDKELPAGNHSVTWNGSDSGGKKVATGIYLYRLEAGDHVLTRKMLLLK